MTVSRVTDILLCTAIDDAGAGEFSAWLLTRFGEPNSLKRLDHLAIGTKAMQADVFGVAINYCDTDDLVAKFQSILWVHPDGAQLLVKEEDWDRFRIYSPGPGTDDRPPPRTDDASITPEQRARELLDRMDVPGALDMTAGDVVELANLIAELDRLRAELKNRT